MTVPAPDYSSTRPVLVTGATGYVAGWLVKCLLEEGKTVHAAVRDPANTDKIGHLKRMAEISNGDIVFFKADLLENGSYREAMEGCDVVFHTASPFTSQFRDPQKDLVDPAVKGTTNVLETAVEVESVERVVLTSSVAAIYGDAADIARAPEGILTENLWNTTSRLDHQPYSFSKVEAEHTAWAIARGQDRWTLVTINPSLVIGPGTAKTQTSESFNILRQFADGTMRTGVPHLEFGAVDVRDVAEAHARAGFIPEAEGRHIVSADTYSLLDIGRVLRSAYGNAYPFPKGESPKWLIWLIGPLLSKSITREYVARNVGYVWTADNSKSKEALGLAYRSVDDAIVEMFRQMVENGAFGKKH